MKNPGFFVSKMSSYFHKNILGLKIMFYFVKEYFEPLISWFKVLFCVECFYFTNCKNIWRRILEIFHLSPLLIFFVAPDILFVETWRLENGDEENWFESFFPLCEPLCKTNPIWFENKDGPKTEESTPFYTINV